VVVFLIKWYGIHGRRIVVHACGDDDDEVKNNKLVSFAARYDYKQTLTEKKTLPYNMMLYSKFLHTTKTLLTR
jgi:hypothetical protein